MFRKKAVLRNFTKLTGKYLCQSLFFNKVAGLLVAASELTGVLAVFFCSGMSEVYSGPCQTSKANVM